MAIVQSSLAEEILSRQERAVIRGIYRASQLNEALVQLEKLTERIIAVNSSVENCSCSNAADKLKAYLLLRLADALVSTKAPANSGSKDSLKLERTT